MEQTQDAAIGVLTGRSRYPVGETIDRLAATAQAAGNTIFARIDHAANAAAAGLSMRPTQVLIFGNAAAGTPVMLGTALVALDLPLRFLAWQEVDGTTHIAWNDPLYFAARYAAFGSYAQLRAMRDKVAALAATVA